MYIYIYVYIYIYMYIYMYICICIYINLENGIGNQSSNPRQSCLYFISMLIPQEKAWI